MDVAYYLKRRTTFIRSFYDESRKPFEEIKRKIEDKIEPFIPPPFDPEYDDAEPPFLEEWMEAEMALQVLGLTCLSMLSDSLKIYFRTLERELGFRPTNETVKKLFKPEGFVAGYRACLSELLATDWSDCPVNFDIIEQVVLARNRGQHGANLMDFSAQHDAATIRKHPRLYFVGERFKDVIGEVDDGALRWFALHIEVNRKNLFAAIGEVENLADYIAEHEDRAHKWRQGKRPENSECR